MTALRILIGLLSVFFAFFLGRVVAQLHLRRQPKRGAITWVLRVAVTLLAVQWTGGFDAVTIVIFALAAAAFAAGVYIEMRPRKDEEIHLFPEEH